RNRRKKRGSNRSWRKRGERCRERAGNHDWRSGRGVCDFLWRAVGSRARLRRNQRGERRYPGGRLAVRSENARAIDNGGVCGLGCLPVSLGVGRDSGEKCEADSVETICFELANKGRFAT